MVTKQNESHGQSMSKILERVLNNHEKLGQLDRKTFEENHSLQKGINTFIEFVQGSTLTYKDLISRDFTKKPLFYVAWKWLKALKP
jgi:hypothetical protein